MMRKLNVLYQASSLYVIPAAISICSLFENNKEIEYIKIWFIDDGLTEEDKEKLKELTHRYKRKLEFINPKRVEIFLEQNNVEKWNGAYATFYKLFVQDEINGVDRLIYIDSDTIINDSLSELIDIDLDGYACGMVASPMSKYIRDYLETDLYFNGGFEIYNMDYWKKNRISEVLLENIKDKNKRFKYTVIADETLINKSLLGKIKKLPLKFNCEATWWFWGMDRNIRKKLGWTDGEGFYSINEVRTAYERPVIMHYTNLTTGRPWDYLNDHPFKNDFIKYQKILKPWKTIEIKNKGFGGDNKVLLFLKWLLVKIMPICLRRRIGFYQHNQTCRLLINSIPDKMRVQKID